MPEVQVREQIPADIDNVWSLVKNVEAYPVYMSSVESIEVIERADDFEITRWRVRLRGSVLTWTERDSFDEIAYRLEYKQTDGDLRMFEGYWQLEPVNDEITQVELVVRFDIGIPLLTDMLNPVAEAAIRDNALSMLHSLQSAASPGGADGPVEVSS